MFKELTARGCRTAARPVGRCCGVSLLHLDSSPVRRAVRSFNAAVLSLPHSLIAKQQGYRIVGSAADPL